MFWPRSVCLGWLVALLRCACRTRPNVWIQWAARKRCSLNSDVRRGESLTFVALRPMRGGCSPPPQALSFSLFPFLPLQLRVLDVAASYLTKYHFSLTSEGSSRNTYFTRTNRWNKWYFYHLGGTPFGILQIQREERMRVYDWLVYAWIPFAAFSCTVGRTGRSCQEFRWKVQGLLV